MNPASGKFEIREILVEEGLKVSPQRMAILEAIVQSTSHPTAETIIENIQAEYPNIAVGTVYKALETFVDKGIIKVFIENDITRYDAKQTKHHHLYYADSDKIEDYYDAELSGLIEGYLNLHRIPEFNIEEVKIQIISKHIKQFSKE